MTSKLLRQKIHALIESRNELAALNVSEQVIENIDFAISELEDAYIAQANTENKTK